MKVKELIKRLENLDQEKEIGIMYQDEDDNTFFPSQIICVQEESKLEMDEELKWKNEGYYMF
jgi:hypothetical protein